jgi:glyoxylase-like metal-dependent hydrolase (beta-lactamase superfamily II)
MQVAKVEAGLWRWTARHPAWTEADGGTEGWGAEVAGAYWETPEAVVLIDPLVPAEPEDRERFWRALDRDVERVGRPVVVLLTCPWHARSTDEITARYDATVADPSSALAGAASSIRLGPMSEELVYWLPGPRSLVVGDVLLGAPGGAVRLCPESWLPEGLPREDVVEALQHLLELPIRRILVSHGEPVLEDGGEALARALARSS